MRRRLSISLTLLGAGVLLLYLSTSQVWFTAYPAANVTSVSRTTYRGGAQHGFSALAVGALAAGAALLATKRRARSIVGLLGMLLGLGVVSLAAHALSHRMTLILDDNSFAFYHRSAAGAPNLTTLVGASTSVWPVVAIVAGVLMALGGVLGALAGGAGDLSAKYESPAGPPPTPVAISPDFADVATWNALDRDEDPTGG